MNRIAAFVIGFLLVAGVTSAQTVVNQGKPGNQGPWPITEGPCTNPVESYVAFDGGSTIPLPTTALASRRVVTICNSPKNAGSPLWTIRADGTAPTTAAPVPGQTLGLGDCITYFRTATSVDGGRPIYGVSDTSSSVVTITECQ